MAKDYKGWQHSYQSRSQHSMSARHTASCRSCQRRVYWKMLHQTQQLRDLKLQSLAEKRPRMVANEILTNKRKRQQSDTPASESELLVSRATTETKRVKVSHVPVKMATVKPSRQQIKAQRDQTRQPAAIRPLKTQDSSKHQPVQTLESSQSPSVKSQDDSQSRPVKAQASSQSHLVKSRASPQLQPVKTEDDSRPQPASRRPSDAVTRKVSKLWPVNKGAPSLKGFYNPGVFCYRRSTSQSLLCVPQFLNILRLHPQCSKTCVVCALRQLAICYHTTTEKTYKAIIKLDRAIERTGATSDPSWDSHEVEDDAWLFLQYLLETVEKAKGIPKADFAATYKIKQRVSWTCSSCHKVHINENSNPASTTLQLPIAGNTLRSCFDAQHRETGLSIRCDGGCEREAPRTRIIEIVEVPDVLTLQLKRFKINNRGKFAKDSSHVGIPETLDLSPWAAQDKQKPANMQYRLESVVLQEGSLNGGHYQAFVRSGKGKWMDMNDMRVGDANLEPLKKKSPLSPYILTYVKVDGTSGGAIADGGSGGGGGGGNGEGSSKQAQSKKIRKK